ncbi:MAG: hypothetical protein ACI88C_000505 [Acidimicrobiales bacterium]|jgi:hypothetical protein
MMTMTSIEVAEGTGKAILEFGRGWMVAPATAARAAELGLGDAGRFGFWVNGRAGVLGEVDSAIAGAAIGFMAPDAVHDYWSARPDSISAWDTALAWFGCAAAWGREALEPMAESDVRRLADLARKVIDRADSSIGALFAGSALIPTPGDAAGDAAINLNVLRELRGCAHLAACHAAGLGPHATIMSTNDPVRSGAPWAEGFGWVAPHPAPNTQARAHVEELTTVAAARSFESLEHTERADFVRFVTAARACVD